MPRKAAIMASRTIEKAVTGRYPMRTVRKVSIPT